MLNTLAIELSQREGSVAACSTNGNVVEESISIMQRETDVVMPAIDRIVTAVDMKPADIELVGVSIGPGGFTGLRTAVSIAKMISLSTDAAIVGVESAIVAADSLDQGDGPYLVISSTKQNSYWQSLVQRAEGHWKSESKLCDVSSLQDAASTVSCIIHDSHLSNEISSAIASLSTPTTEMRMSASSLLHIANDMFESSQTIPASKLLPIYPRQPEAVRKFRALHGDKGKVL